MRSDTVMFSTIVRAVSQEARQLGLMVPGFRSPPRVAGADRTIRRRAGETTIAVRLRGRPFADVAADVVEGILVANRVVPSHTRKVRRQLLSAIEATMPAAA